MPERELVVGAAPRALEALLAEPPAGARAGAVLCHPHPAYGGDMHNAVVVAVARALAASGVAVLRFNFGGVGRSQGAWGGGPPEVEDACAAVRALAARVAPQTPLVLVGYSFGAWVALRAAREVGDVRRVVAIGPPLDFLDWTFLEELVQPVTFIVGERDQFCAPERLARVLEAGGTRMVRLAVRGADHFLVGCEDEVAALVVRSLADLT
jgi:alpha/beta superfamily hydrolase